MYIPSYGPPRCLLILFLVWCFGVSVVSSFLNAVLELHIVSSLTASRLSSPSMATLSNSGASMFSIMMSARVLSLGFLSVLMCVGQQGLGLVMLIAPFLNIARLVIFVLLYVLSSSFIWLSATTLVGRALLSTASRMAGRSSSNCCVEAAHVNLLLMKSVVGQFTPLTVFLSCFQCAMCPGFG